MALTKVAVTGLSTTGTASTSTFLRGDGAFADPFTYMSATGGTITTDGNFKVHTFTSSGNFVPTVGTRTGATDVQYLIVAGGGGGGALGGGGAGGMLSASSLTLSSQDYSIVVGAGGTGASGGSGGSGFVAGGDGGDS